MTDKAKETPSGAAAAAATGLRGVVVGASTVSDVVGDKGELIYQGYNIHDLAKNSNFEEVAFLLWNKRLPKQSELDELNQLLAREFPAERHCDSQEKNDKRRPRNDHNARHCRSAETHGQNPGASPRRPIHPTDSPVERQGGEKNKQRVSIKQAAEHDLGRVERGGQAGS